MNISLFAFHRNEYSFKSQPECILRLHYIGQHLPTHIKGYELELCAKGHANQEVSVLKK